MKILFIFPYPVGSAASQRFRFEQYLPILESENITYKLSPFLSDKTWKIFYKRGFFLQKGMALIMGLFKRMFMLFSVHRYNFVFIHREASPIGPPVIEWIICKVFRKKIIYDFDDAIWIANSSESNRFFSILKWHSNVFKISNWAHKVSAGNEYLKKAIESHNNNVVINPTTIDTDNHHNIISNHTNSDLVIGWTGSHSTIKYLDPLFEVIKDLKKDYTFRFVIISDEAPKNNADLFDFVKWRKETEIEDLSRFNIGVMPLSHDPWSEGKCGFKALQYMSLGIPALVSPVGINEDIVDDGKNGFICRKNKEWKENIKILLENREEIQRMGKEARKKIEAKYSVHSNTLNFIHLFA